MSLNKIKAILLHELYVTKYSVEVINDIILFPIFSIIVFGLMTLYMAGFAGEVIAQHVLTGMILWQVINITQYSIAVGCLWDVWSRNLTNIFITPITTVEYLISYLISGAFKSLFVLIFASIMSNYIFKFNILNLGIANIVIYFIILTVFAFSFAIIVLGLIFRLGTRAQALSWGLLNIFQPLMAVIYPASILPVPFRTIAYMLPPTYIFEAARASINNKIIRWDYIGMALILDIIFLIVAITVFNLLFESSKKSGQFARLET